MDILKEYLNELFWKNDPIKKLMQYKDMLKKIERFTDSIQDKPPSMNRDFIHAVGKSRSIIKSALKFMKKNVETLAEDPEFEKTWRSYERQAELLS